MILTTLSSAWRRIRRSWSRNRSAIGPELSAGRLVIYGHRLVTGVAAGGDQGAIRSLHQGPMQRRVSQEGPHAGEPGATSPPASSFRRRSSRTIGAAGSQGQARCIDPPRHGRRLRRFRKSTANGLRSRFFAVAQALHGLGGEVASQSRWNPPIPLTARILPSHSHPRPSRAMTARSL